MHMMCACACISIFTYHRRPVVLQPTSVVLIRLLQAPNKSSQVETHTGTESKSDGGSGYLRTMRMAQRQCVVSIYVYVYVSPSEEYSERS